MNRDQSHSQKHRVRGWKRFAAGLILGLIAVVSFCAGGLFFLRVGLTGDQIATFLVPHLERALGWQIGLRSAHLSWPRPDTARLTVSGLTCRDKRDGRLFSEVSVASFDIRCTAILGGFLLIERADFVAPMICLSRPAEPTKDGLSDHPAGWIGRCFFLRPVVHALYLDGCTVLTFESDSEGTGYKELFTRIQLVGKNISPDGVQSLSVTGSVPGDQTVGHVEISGRLDSLPLSLASLQGTMQVKLSGCPVKTISSLATLLAVESPFSQGSLDLSLELHARDGDYRIKGEAGLQRAVLVPGGRFLKPVDMDSARAKFSAEFTEGRARLNVDHLVLPGLRLAGTAKAEGPTMDEAVCSIGVRHAELDLRRLFPLLPLKLLAGPDRDRLTAAGLQGHVTITEASWRGKVSDVVNGADWYSTLAVQALVESVYGYLPGFHVPLKNASGRVRLNADEMVFDGISFTLGGSPIVLNGSVTNLKATPSLDLFISAQASGQDLDPVLQSRFVARYLPSWVASVRDPQGALEVKLDLKGSPSRPGIQGTVSLDGFQCQLQGLPVGLKSIKGAVTFERSGRAEAHGEGFIGETASRFEAAWSPDTMRVNLDASVTPGDLGKLGLLPPDWHIGAKMPLRLTLEGGTARPNFTFRLDLKNNRLQIGSWIAKRVGTPFFIEASGSRDRDGIAIEEAYLVIDRTRIAPRGP